MAKRSKADELTIGHIGACIGFLFDGQKIAKRPRGAEALTRLSTLADTEPDRFDACVGHLLDLLEIEDERSAEILAAVERAPARILPFAREAVATERDGAA